MMLSLSLGGALALLGFLLLRAYSKIGSLKKQNEVYKRVIDDKQFQITALIQRIKTNEEIDDKPVSASIGDALDGM